VEYCMASVLLGFCTVRLIARSARYLTGRRALSRYGMNATFYTSEWISQYWCLSDWKEPTFWLTFVACLGDWQVASQSKLSRL